MSAETYRGVHADLNARERQGIKTYGATLRSDTPVDLLRYAYEEALDQAVYLRGELDRRDAISAEADELDRKIQAYGLGDRQSSPAVALLRDYLDALRRLRQFSPPAKKL